ncbi:alkaline phosphatase [Galbibacter sp. EGI 63066]|uniref:alkaline phosphatase n=1 Tax=Galbibacter sp. EGI 63066 TaxID=2993559 RepID=UPI0022499CE4|nr:alkaline phosphatase [Galbibacter sp. EGI 63066]MCX2679449.1 alkaline phosphatase [Galbibacter sp. EGI 63066]
MQTKYLYLGFLILFFVSGKAQQTKIHSHNDYEHPVPFWNAFSSGVHSIEVDVFLKNGQLYATHSEGEIKKGRYIENLYLQPLQKAFALGLGEKQDLQLLIDFKSDAYKTLDALIVTLKKYPKLTQNKKLTFVISGNRPKPSEYINYPEFIKFDYQDLENIPKESWEKVALISLSFRNYSQWNGLGRLTKEDLEKVTEVINKTHAYNKPFRFWATPDTKTAWKAFSDLGIDFINTDYPFTCVNYVGTLSKRVYTNTVFSEVYHPTFKHDQKPETVKNVILMIGDGNGLTQLSAATLANNGALTITQLKSIGLLKTQSSDDFTTDSAAGGTAYATGEKTYNRSIGMDSLRQPITNITELLHPNGYNIGLVTTDQITGATPSAFYAHVKDRGMTSGIVEDFLESNVSLFAAGGKDHFKSYGDFTLVDSPNAIAQAKTDKVGYFMAKNGVPSVLEGRNDLLAEVTQNSLTYLKDKQKPFFLMVEAAKIDSGGHANSTSTIVSEGIDFDKAVSQAILFADQNPGTLVIITADHETGGFSIPQGDMKNHTIEGDFTTNDHTGTLIPIFAYGPHSNKFTGVYENNEVFHKILKLLQIDTK